MARAHGLLRFAMEVAPPQLIRVSKYKKTPARMLETIFEEEMDAGEASTSGDMKSASGSRSRSNVVAIGGKRLLGSLSS
ncbi:hypothetical protein AXF42_Ash012252 [Apostasia shenzhenica]|uniref:Uncharacterized protein n=1 Tax=Apostasia shenzhenica TaxID=1088818 RepID=A0A2I0B4D8_9ASPA|nr:hypothetical protein AXF42_Ash012252 [Apostasia shenzhenica]